ncbi:MAG TPA: DNA-3-methyladenine glycosylase 2 family protein [candidate division CPR3 bacterium]|uniref:DNA-3-methyladenine glycosylase II n=1 Tax=candidate division CPR3 bacterium TaxID=2268181 RepID=A0A7C1NSE1_UNCC3|nr:DNA-3-methyladenine glycosylase 2 family protein [candidate division CPR3 bacterium]
MKSDIKNHFKKVDPILFNALNEIGDIRQMTEREPKKFFQTLCREIICQQLSNASGDAIHNRFLLLFPRQPISKRLVKITDKALRETGMSWAKARYIKDLATKLENKEVNLNNLSLLSDDKVIEELTKIKGIGQWTAKMFLVSALGREDVFSYEDIHLVRSMERVYKMPNISREQAESIALKWSPYRTWASRVLWNL